MSATAKAWARMIAEKKGPERKEPKKEAEQEREPTRVLIPSGGKTKGRTWIVTLKSLAGKIDLEHLDSEGFLYLTEKEIGIHWLTEEK